MSEHTPGPWKVKRPHFCDHIEGSPFAADIGSEDQIDFCFVQSHTFEGGVGKEECAANAKLIAAAPELLSALDEVLAEIGDSYLSCKGSALEVIAKAKGGAK